MRISPTFDSLGSMKPWLIRRARRFRCRVLSFSRPSRPDCSRFPGWRTGWGGRLADVIIQPDLAARLREAASVETVQEILGAAFDAPLGDAGEVPTQ